MDRLSMNIEPKISRAQFEVKTDFAAIQFHEKKVGKNIA